MAAVWQKWMPIYIQRLKSNPYVIAMHPSARAGYLWLFMEQWQSDDCTLPNDVKELRVLSGMGTEWKDHGEEIMDRFTTLGDGRLRNDTCYELWMEAKAKYEEGQQAYDQIRGARAIAGQKGGQKRWENYHQKRSDRLAEARNKARHAADQWKALLEFCGNRCVRCGDDREVVKDHITPIALGGDDGIANLQPLCTSCNASKGADATDYRPGGWQLLQPASKPASKPEANSTFTCTDTNTETVKQEKTSSEASSEPSPLFLDLPAVGPISKFEVSEDLIATCEGLYPAVNVRQEIRNIRGWLDGNPTRRKTHRGMPKFIHAWMSRTQDGGKYGAQPVSTGGRGPASPATARVASGVNAFRRAAEQFGSGRLVGADGADGGPVSPSGHGGGSGELPLRLRAPDGEIRAPSGKGGSAQFAN